MTLTSDSGNAAENAERNNGRIAASNEDAPQRPSTDKPPGYADKLMPDEPGQEAEDEHPPVSTGNDA